MLLFLYLLLNVAMADPIKVAVIDTGIDLKYKNQANLCDSGHISLVPNETIQDYNGHGTNIAGLIKTHAKNTKYCLIIIKFYKNTDGPQNVMRLQLALLYALRIKPDIISLSGGGIGSNATEKLIITKILDSGIKMNVSAGNESMDLDKKCNYFPACYDLRLTVIGAKDYNGSNFGQIVDFYLQGYNQKGEFGQEMTGTSQATAIYTGKMLSVWKRK